MTTKEGKLAHELTAKYEKALGNSNNGLDFS
jgi:hypothetical protein